MTKKLPLQAKLSGSTFTRRRIKKSNISTLEIDLSKFKFEYSDKDKEKLEDIILNSASKKRWIYNNRAAREERLLKEQNKRRLKIQKEIMAKKKEKANDILKNKEVLLKRYSDELEKNPVWIELSKKYNLDKDNMPEFLNVKVKEEMVFACDKRLWQSAIFNKFIQGKRDYEFAISTVEKWIRSRNSKIALNKDIIDIGGKDKIGCSYILIEIVQEYIESLAREGILEKTCQKDNSSTNKTYRGKNC